MSADRYLAKAPDSLASATRGPRGADVSPDAQPEAVLEEMRALLRLGNVQAARELVAAATVKWPKSVELRTAVRVLTKGKSSAIRGKRGPSRDREFEWLKNPPERYRGQWVALLNSEVVGSAGTLKELLASLPPGLEHPPLTIKIAP